MLPIRPVVRTSRSFGVFFNRVCIVHSEATSDAPCGTILYEHGNPQSLAEACRKLAVVIGPHFVEQLTFSEHAWNMPGSDVIFEAAPQVKYATHVRLESPVGSTLIGNSDFFMSHFAGLKELSLWVDYEVFHRFDWAFLHRDAARALRLITFARGGFWSENMNRSIVKLVRHCVTLPRPLGAEALELDFSRFLFLPAFGRWILELLEGSECELIFRMKTLRDGEFVPDDGGYAVHVDETRTRYASGKNGIVVDVQGRAVTIQSIAAADDEEIPEDPTM